MVNLMVTEKITITVIRMDGKHRPEKKLNIPSTHLRIRGKLSRKSVQNIISTYKDCLI